MRPNAVTTSRSRTIDVPAFDKDFFGRIGDHQVAFGNQDLEHAPILADRALRPMSTVIFPAGSVAERWTPSTGEGSGLIQGRRPQNRLETDSNAAVIKVSFRHCKCGRTDRMRITRVLMRSLRETYYWARSLAGQNCTLSRIRFAVPDYCGALFSPFGAKRHIWLTFKKNRY
jgi:hypothetical protein